MMKLYACILALVITCLHINTAIASNTAIEKKSVSNYNGDACSAGYMIIKVKPEFRSGCSLNNIEYPGMINALNLISSNRISKKFPFTKAPDREFNKLGYKLVDLTLVYQIEFSPVVKIDDAIKIIKSTGMVEYAEPVYIQKPNYIPSDPQASSQYQLTKINAYNAWDLWKGDTNTVIGIVDSGTDPDHPDLQANIKYNYADPIDGIDNDSDGYVDNFRGWDLSDNDNDPTVGAQVHGSHVSGCADAVTDNATGVAAPAFNCKFLPVKSSRDTSADSIDNGYDGIVYAADHGANIINCSWGRTGSVSQFEQQTIDYATINKDVLVVSAAGNDAVEETHYPSSYDNVISVAATTSSDRKASFSSYGGTVDVCAPGSQILSTVYNNSYTTMDGTSMASPIAAGCAAMIKSKWPALNALQVGEQLRTTCDNIYGVSGNNAYQGKLGKGRVNLFKAVSDSISPGVRLKDHTVTDGNNNVFVFGDTLSLVCLFENLLRPTTNLTCVLSTNSPDVQIIQSNFAPGILNTFDTVSNFNAAYRIVILSSAALNTEVPFRVVLTDGTWSDSYIFSVVVNVDYINIAINNVTSSITSKSLIGYNQTGQAEGLGFTYKGSASLLYDMGLMVGATGTQVSDNLRSVTAANDADFSPVVNVTSQEPGTISDFDVSGLFTDIGGLSPTGINVNHHAYAWTSFPNQNYIMVQYYIKNSSVNTLNNLYAGLLADWDIPLYSDNKCSTDMGRRMGYVWSTDTNGLYTGIKLLSHTSGFNHYALDNIAGNSGLIITDGFADAEKYTAISTSRFDAGTASTPGNDVLSAVSSGPFNIQPGDSIEVSFALLAGENLDSIQVAADAAQANYDHIFVGILPIGNASENELYQSYPNPADKEMRISFGITENKYTDLSIYNLLGVKVKTVFEGQLSEGKYTMLTDLSKLPAGNYLYRLTSGNFSKALPFNIIHN